MEGEGWKGGAAECTWKDGMEVEGGGAGSGEVRAMTGIERFI